MRNNSKSSPALIDVVGAVALTGCLAGFVWLTLYHNDATNARIAELKQWISAGREDADNLEVARSQKKTLLTGLQKRLAKNGQLPPEAPVEKYFQELSRIAATQGLQVLRQQPMGTRWYPGLAEQRWTYDVKGSTLGLVHFLKDIEGLDHWADVSYLKIDRGAGPEQVAAQQRIASLTISFFFAPPPEQENTDDDT